jgi:hypothetical protein
MPVDEESELGSLWVQGVGRVRLVASGELDAGQALELAETLVDMLRSASVALVDVDDGDRQDETDGW